MNRYITNLRNESPSHKKIKQKKKSSSYQDHHLSIPISPTIRFSTKTFSIPRPVITHISSIVTRPTHRSTIITHLGQQCKNRSWFGPKNHQSYYQQQPSYILVSQQVYGRETSINKEEGYEKQKGLIVYKFSGFFTRAIRGCEPLENL